VTPDHSAKLTPLLVLPMTIVPRIAFLFSIHFAPNTGHGFRC